MVFFYENRCPPDGVNGRARSERLEGKSGLLVRRRAGESRRRLEGANSKNPTIRIVGSGGRFEAFRVVASCRGFGRVFQGNQIATAIARCNPGGVVAGQGIGRFKAPSRSRWLTHR